jgi:hypothetical protein
MVSQLAALPIFVWAMDKGNGAQTPEAKTTLKIID